MTVIPTYAPDLYSRDAILDPYPHYSALRDLGPVVWLPGIKAFALPRYAECKAALADDETFVSGHGVGLNPVVNRLSRGTTLTSDGEEHAKRRRLVAHRLTPRALQPMNDGVDLLAAEVVDAAVARGEVDAVADLAQVLPLSVVPDFVGWPEEGRENLLRWAGATFDALGPINRISARTAPSAIGMLRFASKVARKRLVLPGSMGADVLKAVDDKHIDASECPALMIDYLAPSLDTTISAIASAVWLFAENPEQWEALRADPTRIPNAANEVLRLESPVRAFSRLTARDTEVAGRPIAKGSRVLVMYASANRDDRQWDGPERLDIARKAGPQLGYGYGIHACAGQGLARLETQAMLRVLVERVKYIELTGKPTFVVNNVIRGLSSLPVRLVAA